VTTSYEVIIGLEVHVQLLTESKLFCGCSTKFGEPPNTQTCPVCIGMPGVLPVMNRKAYELAVKAALALNCQIARFTKWDRKNYYYPDLPKGYQISQFDLPLGKDGFLPIGDPKGEIEPKDVGIIRVHLEEDAGKSMHDEQAGKADSRIDLNRTGTPLMEIVSQPDLRSPAEAKAYLTEIKLLMNYLGVSDCNMQEGSLRVDANINLHVHTPDGEVPMPIVEVKNMNSFRAVERALAYEAERQYERWEETGIRLGDPGGHKTTRGWDENAQLTKEQRTKEESSDYRYFPDPDLVPVTPADDQIERIGRTLGELPAALRSRLIEQYAVTPYDADVLVSQGRSVVDYYERVAAGCGDGKAAANWMQQSVFQVLNEAQIDIDQFAVSAEELAALIREVLAGKLETTRARDVLAEMIGSGKPVEEAMKALGITQVDESELESLCRELLEANPGIVADVKSGKLKAAGALIGQAKKKNPNVNPGRVRELCLKMIEKM
jgi:aspartyl-tRNA(Asn)/glutamyl-tRNA(Gln) amidotransferase subunit B